MSTIKEIADGVTDWKLRKAPRSHWNKIAQYEHTNTCIAPLVDGKSGRPKTGLTKDDELRLQKALGLEEFELSPRSAFWRDFMIKVDDSTVRIDLHDPEDELAFLFLRAHKLVAFSNAELLKKPQALYVLYNDVDEAKTQVRRRNVKKEAYSAFANMSTPEMIDVLMVLGKRVVSTDPHIVEAMMGEVVEHEGAAFLDIVGDDDFKIKLFVMKCLHHDLLQKGRGKDIENVIISFHDTVLGEGLSGAVKYLNKQANQKVYLALEKRLQSAQGAGTLAGSPILSGYEVEELVAADEKITGVKKKSSDRKITSRAASGKSRMGANSGIQDSGSTIKEVTGEGHDSGEYDDAPEVA